MNNLYSTKLTARNWFHKKISSPTWFSRLLPVGISFKLPDDIVLSHVFKVPADVTKMAIAGGKLALRTFVIKARGLYG